MAEMRGEDFGALSDEARPTGDFIDGWLAAMAAVNAAMAGVRPDSYFFSFDWIGDGEEAREDTLRAAFPNEIKGLRFDVELLRDWRAELTDLGGKWLARDLPDEAGEAVVDEFLELIGAFVGDQPAEVFRVRPIPPGNAKPAPADSHDHVLFETSEGRLFLEFSAEV